MASRKTASKTSRKATISLDWSVDKGTNKKSKRNANKHIKKLSFGAIMIALLVLVVGALSGYFGVKYLVKDDCFTLNGKDEIILQVGESYTDEGAKVIAFGRDDAGKVSIETNLTKNENGTYTSDEVGTFYMVYTVDNFKYGTLFKIQKIRLITFVEAAEQEEIDSANQGGDA